MRYLTVLGFTVSAAAFVVACGGSEPADGNMTTPGGTIAGNGSTIPGAGSGGAVQAGGGNGGTAQAGGAGGDVVGGGNGAGGAIAGAGGAGVGGASGGGAGGTAGVGGAGSGFMVPMITWPSAECVTMAATKLATMTKRQKAAQMVMAPNPGNTDVSGQEVGAVFAPGGAMPPGGNGLQSWATMIDGYIAAAATTPLAIPILYGLDGVHGNNTATGTVIFPHNAGLGSSRNPQLVEQIGQIAAQEIRATGANWTFGPMVSVSFDDRWGRVYESFSEDPVITAELSAAMVIGLQGRGGLGTGQPGIIACAKHWAGDGQATAGTSGKNPGVVDRGNVQIDETTMRTYGIAPYLPALQAGLGSVMVSDARWNDENMTGHTHLMTDILKTELGFKGFVSSDWMAATETVDPPGVVGAAEAGVDMFMHPNDWQGAIDAIEAGVTEARIDDAVTRLLQTKCQAGLFTSAARDTAQLASVGSAEHRMVGRQAVRESLVLAQNTGNVLPLAKTANVWVGGSGADDIGRQCGGWTISWQGSSGATTEGTTILEAVTNVVAPAASMQAADVVVVVLSEAPYAEFQGDKASIDQLSQADFQLLTDAKAAGKQVVAIVMSGRPVLITDHLADADAWIIAWLPGTEGDGVADVLFGDFNPTGKLSHSWPKDATGVNINMGQPGYDPLFILGHGLSY